MYVSATVHRKDALLYVKSMCFVRHPRLAILKFSVLHM